MLALYQVFGANRHVIVEVIKTKLVFCAVHDIHKTGFFVVAHAHAIPIFPLFFHNKTFHTQCAILYYAYGEAEEQIYGSQPHGIALGQVGVYSDQMYAAPQQTIQVQSQARGQCLAFACGHFGDLALMQYGRTDQLHVVGYFMPHNLIASPIPGFAPLLEAATRFLKNGKCLWVNFIEYVAFNILDFGFDLGNGFQLFGAVFVSLQRGQFFPELNEMFLSIISGFGNARAKLRCFAF